MVLPFFAVRRVEKISSQTSTIAITVWHQMKILFQLIGDKNVTDKFCDNLRDKLQAHIGLMKHLKSFLSQCSSEILLNERFITDGGLGIKFGYVDTKRLRNEKKQKKTNIILKLKSLESKRKTN